MTHTFQISSEFTADKLLVTLGKYGEIEFISKQYSIKTFYDSFDWRLWRNDIICEHNRSKTESVLYLSNRKSGQFIASAAIMDMPAYAAQFNPGKLRKIFESILEMRALLSVCTLECVSTQLNLLDAKENLAARIVIDEYVLLKNRLKISPEKGYGALTKLLLDYLKTEIGLAAEDKPVLEEALRLQARRPKEYSSKPVIKLSPDMASETACKLIFKELLRIIKANEQGVIADRDSEFLHDFRVAVRKTRVGLSQLKGALPETITARNKEFFSWLGGITGEVRDLDVHLLSFDNLKKKLPVEDRQSINPLQNFLSVKKNKSQKLLAKKLSSKKYLKALAKWEEFLASSPSFTPIETAECKKNIKEFADRKIWKVYKQIRKQGAAVKPDSPAQNLHNLRKICKKLRYLLEFFDSLYPESKLEKLSKNLKDLQDILGKYQDCSIQQHKLEQYSEEMRTINAPAKTFLTMGILIQDLEIEKVNSREKFDRQFKRFNKPKNRELFQKLFCSVNDIH